MKKLFLAMAMTLLLSSTAMASDPYLGAYCSGYNAAGDWEISFSSNQEIGFHCALVQQALVGRDSPVVKLVKGYYDRFDMNNVELVCDESNLLLTRDGFGERVIERTIRTAELYEARGCLFTITPHF